MYIKSCSLLFDISEDGHQHPQTPYLVFDSKQLFSSVPGISIGGYVLFASFPALGITGWIWGNDMIKKWHNWLVVYLPLWKIWVRQLGWWHSQYMESHKIPWFQSPPTKYSKSGFYWAQKNVVGILSSSCLRRPRVVPWNICVKTFGTTRNTMFQSRHFELRHGETPFQFLGF